MNGHNKEENDDRKSSKKDKISINLVDSLPGKIVLNRSHSSNTKTKKTKKNKKSSDKIEKTSKSGKKKSHKLEDLLGQPYIAPVDQGPDGDEYLEI